MARFRKRKQRGRSLKRKRRSFRGKSGRSFRKRVKSVVQSFAEKKWLDNQSSTPVSNAGAVILFNDVIAQGTGSNQRVGLEVQAKSLKLNLVFGREAATPGTRRFRLIVGCWHDYTSTTPTISQILFNPTLDYSMYDRVRLAQKEWTPMYNRQFTIQGDGIVNKTINLSFFGKKLPNKRVVFNSSNVVQNAWFLAVFSDYVGAGPFPQMFYTSRLTFTDI